MKRTWITRAGCGLLCILTGTLGIIAPALGVTRVESAAGLSPRQRATGPTDIPARAPHGFARAER
jgi:hypothetical protein